MRARAVVRRLREARPASELAVLRCRVESLETATAENHLLHGPLEDLVTRLERDVTTCLAQRHAAEE